VSRKTAHGGQNNKCRPRSANGYCASWNESESYACVPVYSFVCIVRKRETRARSNKGVAVSRADSLGRSRADDIGSWHAGENKSAMAQKAIVVRHCYAEWHAHRRSGRQVLFIPSWDEMVAGMRDGKVVVGQECNAEIVTWPCNHVVTKSRGVGASRDGHTKGIVFEDAPHRPPHQMFLIRPHHLAPPITPSKTICFSQKMDRITRGKPRKYKGLHQKPSKTSRRELTVVERVFVAGACIAGTLSHNDCAKLMHPRCTKSTITRVCQRVNQMAEDLSCSISDPRCIENPTNRDAERKLTDAQEQMVIDFVTSDREHREKEAWQLIQEGHLEATGLPKISISLLENIPYRAGYSRQRPG
jgi:hypothetical protein